MMACSIAINGSFFKLTASRFTSRKASVFWESERNMAMVFEFLKHKKEIDGVSHPELDRWIEFFSTQLAGLIRDFQTGSESKEEDALSTMVLNDRIVKILAWYDNEWGYSARLVDFAELMAGKGLTMEKA